MSDIFYSENGEDYRHDELSGAAGAILDDETDLHVGFLFSVWQGICNPRKASSYAPDVLEAMENDAYDEMPEFSDSWPDATVEQRKELADSILWIIDTWADKYHHQPNFGAMSECKERFFKVTKMAEFTDDIEYIEITDAE